MTYSMCQESYWHWKMCDLNALIFGWFSFNVQDGSYCCAQLCSYTLKISPEQVPVNKISADQVRSQLLKARETLRALLNGKHFKALMCSPTTYCTLSGVTGECLLQLCKINVLINLNKICHI